MVRRIPEDTLSRDTANLCKDNCFILIRQTIERNLLQLPNLFTVWFKVQHTTYTLSYTFAENKVHPIFGVIVFIIVSGKYIF